MVAQSICYSGMRSTKLQTSGCHVPGRLKSALQKLRTRQGQPIQHQGTQHKSLRLRAEEHLATKVDSEVP